MANEICDTLEKAWEEAMKHLTDEKIMAVEIHWGHGTITLCQALTGDTEQPYKGWELIEDA